MYCDRRQLEAEEGHDTSKCIVTKAKGMRQGIISQYNAQQAHDTAACTLRYRHGGCHTDGTARRGAGHGAQGHTRERCDTAALGCDTVGGLGHDTARPAHDTARSVRAWVCLCTPGWAGWASRLWTWCTQPVFLPSLTQYYS